MATALDFQRETGVTVAGDGAVVPLRSNDRPPPYRWVEVEEKGEGEGLNGSSGSSEPTNERPIGTNRGRTNGTKKIHGLCDDAIDPEELYDRAASRAIRTVGEPIADVVEGGRSRHAATVEVTVAGTVPP